MMRFQVSAVISIVYAIGFVGCGDLDHAKESAIDQSELSVCSSVAMQSIDPLKELTIRDLSVVEDPCRTTFTPANPAACPAGSIGKWTFGRLMTVMSGATDPTSPQARTFVAKWLSFWWTNQLVGSDPTPVASRHNITAAWLNPWLAASGCAQNADPGSCTTLDLTTAPLRLLAVVNRVDMDGRDPYSGLGAPGELRFVFGAFRKDSTTTPPDPFINAAVILEYHLPSTGPTFPAPGTSWANNFHQLSSMAFGPSFSAQLQSITDRVVDLNAQPGNPNNGSSISQIRTNENAFDTHIGTARTWEFRQFALVGCSTSPCLLSEIPVSQTPPTSLNNSATLTDYMVANQDVIAAGTHVVPTSMLGGSAISLPGNLPGSNAVLWDTATDINTGVPTLVNPSDVPLSLTVRHDFAFSTCNGCHYLETANQNSQFHIKPRNKGVMAATSPFVNRSLATSDGGATTTDYLAVDDPNPNGIDPINGTAIVSFSYNEMWRRSCEVRRLMAGFSTPFTAPTGHNE